ncbi:MAG TPA: DNA adenine methylase, partial [Candidatus Sumerlaeota bacterium]|nr:DNA adenine methylase [Candidatus Sumerlaeota bacterium]
MNCMQKSPVVWMGGKSRIMKHLLPLIPEHKRYVEVFGGSGALLFTKDPLISEIEVYNDLDGGLVHFFRTLRNKEQFAELERLCSLTVYSREEWVNARDALDAETDPVQRAFLWYVVNRMSFGGRHGGSWGSVTTSCSGPVGNRMAGTAARWISG